MPAILNQTLKLGKSAATLWQAKNTRSPHLTSMTTYAYACLSPYRATAIAPDDFPTPVDCLYVDRCLLQEPHPERARLLQDCQRQPPDQLLVRELGDLGESPAAVFDTLKALEALGIRVLAAAPHYRTPEPRSPAPDAPTLLQWADTIRHQHLTQQLQAGHARNRLDLRPPPGRAPYGYRRSRYRYALDKSTAPAVKAFFEHFILYGSIRGAARFLEKSYGKNIAPSTAQRWLQHPVYRGDSEYQDGSIIRDTHTPIISREEAAQVDRLLRRNRQLPPKTVSAERSLAGLVQCAECQSKLRVSRVTRPRQAQEYLYLRPLQCSRATPCRAIAYAAVLDQTVAAICSQFPQAVENLKAPPVGAIKASLAQQIEEKTSLITQVAQLQQQGVLDKASADLRQYTLRGEMAELEQRRSQLPPENLTMIAQTLSSPAFWQDLSESERRVYLREFIQTIWIERCDRDWTVTVQFVF